MMKTRLLISSILFLLVGISCNKEKKHAGLSDPDCLSYPQAHTSGPFTGFKGYQVSEVGDDCFNPIFNPLNENEFIYTRVHLDTLTWKNVTTLMKHNLILGKSEELLVDKATDEVVAFTPDGHIVYVIDPYHFGIMNSDGSNKQVFLEKDMPVSSFAFDRSMSRMIMSFVHNGPPVTVIYHLDGSGTDTFIWEKDAVFFHRGDWSGRDSLVTLSFDRDFYGVSVVGISEQIITNLFNRPFSVPHQKTFNVKWHPDNETVYFANEGYGIYRYRDGVLSQVKANCDNKQYRMLSISPSGKKMLVERQDRVKLSDKQLNRQFRISIMNIDGSGEVLLDLE